MCRELLEIDQIYQGLSEDDQKSFLEWLKSDVSPIGKYFRYPQGDEKVSEVIKECRIDAYPIISFRSDDRDEHGVPASARHADARHQKIHRDLHIIQNEIRTKKAG